MQQDALFKSTFDLLGYLLSLFLKTEKLRSEVRSANVETDEAVRELTDYKETVTSLKCELNATRDVEKMHNEQVTDSHLLVSTVTKG